jgi:hypothetical protein
VHPSCVATRSAFHSLKDRERLASATQGEGRTAWDSSDKAACFRLSRTGPRTLRKALRAPSFESDLLTANPIEGQRSVRSKIGAPSKPFSHSNDVDHRG